MNTALPRYWEHPFFDRLQKGVFFAAGSIGTSILELDLGPENFTAFQGTEKEETYLDCPEWLNVSRPEVLQAIFRSFYEVGCDAVDACTFGANEIVLAEFDLAPRTFELNRTAAQLVGQVRDEFSTPDHPRFSFGSIGPGTKLPSLSQTDFETLHHSYTAQVMGLIEGGIDVLKVETCQDLLQTKVALIAIADVFAEWGKRLPVIASVTFEATGSMLLGSDSTVPPAVLNGLDVVDLMGINCATGPEQMVDHIRYFTAHCRRPLFVGPNAGLPEIGPGGKPIYPLSPVEFTRWQKQFVSEFGISVVGGCCGTTPQHFTAAISALRGVKPRPRVLLGKDILTGELVAS